MPLFSAWVKPQFSTLLSNPLLSLAITYAIRSSDSSMKTTSSPEEAVRLTMFRPSFPHPTTPIFENKDLLVFFAVRLSPNCSSGSIINSLICLYLFILFTFYCLVGSYCHHSVYILYRTTTRQIIHRSSHSL